jgi:phosphoribosyl 1,2-cyclic phosphodiesterase
MSLELCILASGSMGNAAVLRCPSGAMLIDFGIGPRTLEQRLNGTGVRVADLRAVCLTHLDSDHFDRNCLPTLVRRQIPIHCHAQAACDVVAENPTVRPLVRAFDADAFKPLPGVTFEPISLAHDREGSHGFVIDGFGYRIGYATDLGRVPPALIDRFRGCDLVAIESNYDPEMQEASARPAFLKRRITGGSGHLSNGQALAAVREILDRAAAVADRLPEHIVLLHRSQQCNCPRLLRRTFARDPRIAVRLTLAEQHRRTEWLRRTTVAPAFGEQLTLGF